MNMENNVEKKKSNVFVIILIMILSIGLGVAVGYIVFNNNDNQSNNNNNINNNEIKNNENKEEKKQEESKVLKQVVKASTGKEDVKYSVELTSKGEVILNTDKIKDKVVGTDVVKAVYLKYGQSDICGHEIIAMIKEDNTLSAFYLSDVICNEEATDVSFFNSLSSLTSVVDIYNDVEFVNEYEPLKNNVIVQYKDGTTKDITSYFKK